MVRIMKNAVENNIVCLDHLVSIGRAIIRVISMSKMINRTISRKNRMENGFRGVELSLIPHSKDEFLFDHFFISFLRNTGIIRSIQVINEDSNIYCISSCIIGGHSYKEKLIGRRYRPE